MLRIMTQIFTADGVAFVKGWALELTRADVVYL
jgi:hypothetical protein